MNRKSVLLFSLCLFACPPKKDIIVYPDSVPSDDGKKNENGSDPSVKADENKVYLNYYSPGRTSFERVSNSIVSDNVDNIIWTKVDNSDGKFLTMEAAKKAGHDMTYEQATQYCSNLSLDIYSDWRLPSLEEAQNLVDAPVTTTLKPFKDATKEIQLPYDFYVTGYGIWTSQLSKDGSEVSLVFLDGTGAQSVKISNAGSQVRVLCVHNKNTPSPQPTKLMWATTDNGKGIRPTFGESNKYVIDWNEANKYCDELSFADYVDWRLPTIGEARTLFIPELPGYTPIVDLKQAVHVPDDIKLSGYGIWTSEVRGTSEAADVGLGNGRTYWHDKTNKSYIVRALCVRDTK